MKWVNDILEKALITLTAQNGIIGISRKNNRYVKALLETSYFAKNEPAQVISI